MLTATKILQTLTGQRVTRIFLQRRLLQIATNGEKRSRNTAKYTLQSIAIQRRDMSYFRHIKYKCEDVACATLYNLFELHPVLFIIPIGLMLHSMYDLRMSYSDPASNKET